MRKSGIGSVKRCKEVNGKNSLPVGWCQFHNRPWFGQTGIVNEQIQVAELTEAVFDQAIGHALIGNITGSSGVYDKMSVLWNESGE